MKANIKKQNNSQKTFGENGLRLSIGMIVKNEAKTLDRCLKSLQPLLSAVPSELIITDTGSTDETVEIAKKYTDHIISFEWCNDFSAARNTGLDAARGEWFMFLDADEWFEDVTELIEFFNSGEYDEYGSGSFIVRNYQDVDGTSYLDFHASRMYRRYPGMRFTGIVHENIPGMKPYKYLEAYVHHYGYLHQTRESMLRKFQRNSELLKKQIEEEPSNLKAYFQLANEYLVAKEYNQAIETAKAGLQIEQKCPNEMWRAILHCWLEKSYFSIEDNKSILKDTDDLVNAGGKEQIPLLDCFYYGINAAAKLKDYSKVIEFGEKYLGIYKKYHAKKLDMTALMMGWYSFTEAKDKNEVLGVMAQCCVELDDRENAARYVKQLDLSLPGAVAKAHSVYAALCDRFNDWSLLPELLQDVLALHDQEQMDIFVAYMETYVNAHPIITDRLLEAFLKTNADHDYTRLWQLRSYEKAGDHHSSQPILNAFSQSDEKRKYFFSDILYYAMLEGLDIERCLLQFNADELLAAAANIQKQHSEFTEDLVQYVSAAKPEQSVLELRWVICLLDRMILEKAKSKEAEQCAELLRQYTVAAKKHMEAVYQKDFLRDNLSLLPGDCRFAYWAEQALSAKQKGDGASYLRNLNTALKNYPVMKDPIKLLLKHFEDEDRQNQANTEEFAALAKEMKKRIRALINQGSLQEAGALTDQLAELLPGDKEILQLQQQIKAVPTLQEIAAGFPQ